MAIRVPTWSVESYYKIKNNKISKEIIKEIVNALLENGCTYNKTHIASSSNFILCIGKKFEGLKKFQEKKLGDNNLDKAIDIITQGGDIKIDYPLTEKDITDLTILFRQDNEDINLSFSIPEIHYWENPEILTTFEEFISKSLQKLSTKYKIEKDTEKYEEMKELIEKGLL